MILSLQNLYELRKSHSNDPRNGHARVFSWANRFGLWDASGVLFPVDGIEQFDGKSVSFSGSFTGHLKPTKYLDNGFYFKVTNVTQINSGGKAPKFDFSAASVPDHSHFYRNEIFQKMRFVSERSRYIGRTISFFENRGFLNIDAPILVSSGGIECHMESFQTHYTDHRGQVLKMELPTSPEMSLKKILAKGVPKVFSVAKSFRNNGELSKWHEPEFLMLEWYRASGTLESLMSETMDFVIALLEQMEHSALLRQAKLTWPVFSMRELFINYVGLDLNLMQDVNLFYAQSKSLSMDIRETDDWGTIYFKLLFRYVEPFLVTLPICFVRDFPIQLGALAATNGNYVQRFELYMSGIEMCNGYVELTDPQEYQERLQQALAHRPHLARDAEFDLVMSAGLPPSVGNAVGLDRLIGFLMSRQDIASALPLPFLRRFPTAAKE